MVDQNDSIIELARLDATRPVDPSRPASPSRWPKTPKVYWLPRSGVDYSAGLGATSPDRRLQGVDDQLGAHVVRDRRASPPLGG